MDVVVVRGGRVVVVAGSASFGSDVEGVTVVSTDVVAGGTSTATDPAVGEHAAMDIVPTTIGRHRCENHGRAVSLGRMLDLCGRADANKVAVTGMQQLDSEALYFGYCTNVEERINLLKELRDEWRREFFDCLADRWHDLQRPGGAADPPVHFIDNESGRGQLLPIERGRGQGTLVVVTR